MAWFFSKRVQVLNCPACILDLFNNRKHLEHQEMRTITKKTRDCSSAVDCWTATILYQIKIGQKVVSSNPRCLQTKEERTPHGGKHGPVSTYWYMFLPSHLKLLCLNTGYFSVPLWIKYKSGDSEFCFTFYTSSYLCWDLTTWMVFFFLLAGTFLSQELN